MKKTVALLVQKENFLQSLGKLKIFFTILLEAYHQAEIEEFEKEYVDELKSQLELVGNIIHGFDSSLDSDIFPKKPPTLN